MWRHSNSVVWPMVIVYFVLMSVSISSENKIKTMWTNAIYHYYLIMFGNTVTKTKNKNKNKNTSKKRKKTFIIICFYILISIHFILFFAMILQVCRVIGVVELFYSHIKIVSINALHSILREVPSNIDTTSFPSNAFKYKCSQIWFWIRYAGKCTVHNNIPLQKDKGIEWIWRHWRGNHERVVIFL